jgi:hypothetical protein
MGRGEQESEKASRGSYLLIEIPGTVIPGR